tara:strand:+ start:1630 stop:2568 length:939 start_codon:yes stop_codon:yes gene_type:complete
MNKVVVGIDIGGTITKIGLIDKKGKCISKISFRTKENNEFDDFIKNIKNSIVKLNKKKLDISSIGIGAPNANSLEGTIETPANLKWKGKLEIIKKLNNFFNIPIKLSNDANCAAMGEMLYGNAKSFSDFIVITLGTGLGSGIVSNGKLVQGFDGFAGELGHFSINNDGRLTGLGIKGGLESYASATGLKRTIMYMLAKYTDNSIFREVPFNNLHGEDITKAAENNDPIAIKSYEYTGKILGKSLANFVSFSQPEAIILTGGLANSGKWILKPTIYHFEKNLLPFYKNKVKILESGLEEKDAAILGAAALAWK